ncbi:hypothetical protein C8Q80DRAFT_1139182 [Daedaleopsis nitida]|nr:hypothetical protein C8Q80DRAFT_1139182 [Daedaleopsis nitida]
MLQMSYRPQSTGMGSLYSTKSRHQCSRGCLEMRTPSGEYCYFFIAPPCACSLNAAMVRRLNAFAVYRGNDKCTNLAMADPAHLKITNKNFLASPVTPLKPGLFYSVGIATLSKLFDVQADTRTRARQLCVAVSDVSWPRAMAVATSAFKAVEYINLSTFSHGVSFSTRLKPALDKENNSSAPIAGISGSQSPSPGKAGYNVSVPILPWNAEVAVFDGRQKFTFAQYQNLPRRHEEIPVGSAVMVFFTLHTYQRGGTCLSLNLQHVVMLALPEASQRDEADMPPERIIMPGVKEPVAAAVLLELGSDDDVFAM